ncbi:MAG TPA: glycine--tRNA ligase [Candidatus Magasanikbacteria bacterium]|nr:glycine--tRNA ligase [Candidatus Magasanikbacteria bacterium]
MSQDIMEALISLCKRRGFIFPGSDIYGGLANAWDYGPLGAQMKKNIKDLWWKKFVESRPDMVPFDGAILMNPKVWEASGHVATFNDPLVECKNCHGRFRADHVDTAKNCPTCGKKDWTPAKQFNLMFKTFVGPSEESANAVYLRPETAQAMFVNFKHVANTSRKRLPFGIAQIGKAFRNEITPGNFIFRTLEFEQMEIEYFIEESDWEKLFEAWLKDTYTFAEALGIKIASMHDFEVPADERAHYSKRTVDIMFDFPFGQKELWGLAYRGDYDLKQHEAHSKQSLEYTDPDDNKRKIIPHVIEPSFGVDRTLLAVLVSAYEEQVVKEGDTRVVLHLKPAIAPYHIAVLPLMKKDGLAEEAHTIHEALLKHFRSDYDESGSVGKRYRRHDEIGTPYCVTVDYETKDDRCVTVRDRDTMTQERVKIDELIAYFSSKINS